MKWLLIGVVLGLLLVYPSLLTVLVTIAAAILSKPLLVAFGLGVAAGVKTPRMSRRVR